MCPFPVVHDAAISFQFMSSKNGCAVLARSTVYIALYIYAKLVLIINMTLYYLHEGTNSIDAYEQACLAIK